MKKKPSDRSYYESLNAIVDVLFQVAYEKKLDWIEMAKLSGLSRETVHRLGSRVTKLPQFRTIERLANALGGKMDYTPGVARKKVSVKWTLKVFKRKAA